MSALAEGPQVSGKPDVHWLRAQYRRVLDGQIGMSPWRGPFAPAVRTWIFAAVLCLTGVGILPGLVLIGIGFKRFGEGKSKRAELLDSVAGFEPVMAYVHMANTALMQPGRGDAPALVVFSFESHLTAAYFQELCERIMVLGLEMDIEEEAADQKDQPEHLDEATRSTVVFFDDMSYVEGCRFRIPDKFTGGPDVYAAHLWIKRHYLPGHVLQWPMLPCMAQPGDSGHLGLMPGWFALGEARPPVGWQQLRLDLDEVIAALIGDHADVSEPGRD